jgi:uncharacterized protein (TIGR02246 family)
LSAVGQVGGAESAEEISKVQAAAYVAAFNKQDSAALAALFTADAEYTVNEGDAMSGRDAISAQTKAFFAATADAKLEIVVESSRFLTAEVISERGFATVAASDGTETTRYTATQVKKNGKWLIAELLEETLPSADPAADALSSLEWIIGKWKVETAGIDAETEATWTLDGHFITRTTRIAQEDGGAFVSVEVIGYDPVADQLQSWIVDNEGGFGSNLWRRDDNKWLIRSKATSPDGGQSSSQHILTVLDEKSYGLETINRILDGEALPNRDQIKIVRVADSK